MELEVVAMVRKSEREAGRNWKGTRRADETTAFANESSEVMYCREVSWGGDSNPADR
jgi:hypothetical protein